MMKPNERTSFMNMLVLMQDDYVVGMLPKSEVMGFAVALDDEHILNIYLRDGRIVKHHAFETLDDEIARIASDMGWY